MRDNPLGKIPTLVLEDGTVIYDSPVICEYLDTLHDGPKLFPAWPERLMALRRQALGDGMLDIALALLGERFRPAEQQSEPHMSTVASQASLLRRCSGASGCAGGKRLHDRPSRDRHRAVLSGFPLWRSGLARWASTSGRLACGLRCTALGAGQPASGRSLIAWSGRCRLNDASGSSAMTAVWISREIACRSIELSRSSTDSAASQK